MVISLFSPGLEAGECGCGDPGFQGTELSGGEAHVFGPGAGWLTFCVLGSDFGVNCCHGGWRKGNGLERAFPNILLSSVKRKLNKSC